MTGDLRERIADAANGYDAPDLVDEVLAAVQRRAAAAVKVCGPCAEPHPLSAFGLDASRADGLNPFCRVCRAALRRQRQVSV